MCFSISVSAFVSAYVSACLSRLSHAAITDQLSGQKGELVMEYFTFEVEVEDDTKTVRRFRASNYQTDTRVSHPGEAEICTLPLRFEEADLGSRSSTWHELWLDLQDTCRRAYGTNYANTRRITIHPNCRLRRVFFAEKKCSADELPAELRLHGR